MARKTDPDADLIRSCGDYHVLRAQFHALDNVVGVTDTERSDLNSLLNQTMEEVAAEPSTTLDGLRAKASVVQDWVDHMDPDMPDRLMFSLTCDILRGVAL
jgi:hypothetical protein